MGEFFGKPTFGTPQGVYSWQHLFYVSFLMIVMILLAIFIGLKFSILHPFKNHAFFFAT